MAQRLVLSAVQLEPFLVQRAKGQTAFISPDLGLTEVQVEVHPRGIVFPSGQLLLWEAAKEIVNHPSVWLANCIPVTSTCNSSEC